MRAILKMGGTGFRCIARCIFRCIWSVASALLLPVWLVWGVVRKGLEACKLLFSLSRTQQLAVLASFGAVTSVVVEFREEIFEVCVPILVRAGSEVGSQMGRLAVALEVHDLQALRRGLQAQLEGRGNTWAALLRALSATGAAGVAWAEVLQPAALHVFDTGLLLLQLAAPYCASSLALAERVRVVLAPHVDAVGRVAGEAAVAALRGMWGLSMRVKLQLGVAFSVTAMLWLAKREIRRRRVFQRLGGWWEAKAAALRSFCGKHMASLRRRSKFVATILPHAAIVALGGVTLWLCPESLDGTARQFCLPGLIGIAIPSVATVRALVSGAGRVESVLSWLRYWVVLTASGRL